LGDTEPVVPRKNPILSKPIEISCPSRRKPDQAILVAFQKAKKYPIGEINLWYYSENQQRKLMAETCKLAKSHVRIAML